MEGRKTRRRIAVTDGLNEHSSPITHPSWGRGIVDDLRAQAATLTSQGPRSTKDQITGSFHEVKGTIKEQVGKAANDRDLKAAGRAEKNAGKVQQQIGHAKETVAKLRGKLAEIKAG
jgi:uncharacterized protein YjbJ (UPF0337 family)